MIIATSVGRSLGLSGGPSENHLILITPADDLVVIEPVISFSLYNLGQQKCSTCLTLRPHRRLRAVKVHTEHFLQLIIEHERDPPVSLMAGGL